jgi:putative glutamine amidotransferase
MKPKKVIGIAAGRRYENYLNWLRQDPDVKVIKLSHEDHNFDQLKQCDALVLSGGEDVHPRFYGKPEYVSQYHLDDLDEARDEFEMGALEFAGRHGMPVLGICRGLQLANAFFKGTLIPDIPSFGKPDHTKFGEGKDRYHAISVAAGTLLENITGANHGEVNSAHHQSVDSVAPGFVVNAVSADGIVEGLERQDAGHHSFILLVQWHPERMKDQASAFSKNIRERFLSSITPH